jgi:hypothetical protein
LAKRELDLYGLSTCAILGPPQELTGEDAVNYVAALLEISRVGSMSVEKQQFQYYVESNLGIEPLEIELGREKAATHRGALSELVSGIENPEVCAYLFRDAYLMTLMHKGGDCVEWMILERLSGALGLSASLAKKIVKMVDDLVKLHRDFLDVLEEAGIEK